MWKNKDVTKIVVTKVEQGRTDSTQTHIDTGSQSIEDTVALVLEHMAKGEDNAWSCAPTSAKVVIVDEDNKSLIYIYIYFNKIFNFFYY